MRWSCPRPVVRSALVGVALVAVAAPRPSAGQEATPSAGRLTGYIYAQVEMRTGDADPERFEGVVAIDPNTGEWLTISDRRATVRVSPDGKAVAFARGGGVWTSAVGGMGDAKKIADAVGCPIWSSDGKRLVFSKRSAADGNAGGGDSRQAYETWHVESDGSHPIKLPIAAKFSAEDWSFDGRSLAATSNGQVYIVCLDGTVDRCLTTEGYSVAPRFSADGRRVAYCQIKDRVCSLVTVRVDGTGRRTIYEDPKVAPTPCWSPDGKWLAVVMFDWVFDERGRLVLGQDERPDFRIEIMDADGKNRRRLKLPPALHIGAPDWR